MTYIITKTSKNSGLQVASLAEIGRVASAVILIFDHHNKAKATAVAILPDGRRFINRALLTEGVKWSDTNWGRIVERKPGAPEASRVHYVFDEDIRPDADYEPGRLEEYSLVEGHCTGTWYLIGLGEGGKAWQELPEESSGKRPAIDSKLLRWVEHNLLRFTDVLKVGDQIEVFQNQAYRYGQVVARIGTEILGVFTYKNGRNVLYVWNFGIPESSAPNWGSNPIRYFPQYDAVRSVSFNSIPKKWVDELAKIDPAVDPRDFGRKTGSDNAFYLKDVIYFLKEEFSGEDNTI